MYVTRDIYKIYNWFLEDSGYETLAKIPYENRKLQYEDVFPVLYLKYRMLGGTRHKHIKHLVIERCRIIHICSTWYCPSCFPAG